MFGPLAQKTIFDGLIQIGRDKGLNRIPQQLEGAPPLVPFTFKIAQGFLPFCQKLLFQPSGNLLSDAESFLDTLVLCLPQKVVSGFLRLSEGCFADLDGFPF